MQANYACEHVEKSCRLLFDLTRRVVIKVAMVKSTVLGAHISLEAKLPVSRPRNPVQGRNIQAEIVAISLQDERGW